MSDNSQDTGSPPPPHMGHPVHPGHGQPPPGQYPVMGDGMEQCMVSDGHPGAGGPGGPLPTAVFQRTYSECNNKNPQA